MAGNSRPANSGSSSQPLPVIGVRRAIVQGRAHDDDHAAPTVAPGPGVFSLGQRIGGFVDSWPKTLVPSASNRSTPEWTPVDSGGLRWTPAKGDATKSNFALGDLEGKAPQALAGCGENRVG